MSATPPAGSSAKAGGRDGKFKPGAAPKGKPFEKGRSGNPRGTSALQAEVKALALSHSTEAIETLVTLMRSKDTKVSLAAAVAILDRGLGKPAQTISAGDGGPLVNITMGAPITTAAEAAAVYAQLVGDVTADQSSIEFAAPAPYPSEPAAPAELPALPQVAQEPPAVSPAQAVPHRANSLEQRLAAAEQRAEDQTAVALQTWARLGE